MLKDFVRAEYRNVVEYELCFDDGENNGFGFPCDANGNVFPLEHEAARNNLEWCMEHPEKFKRYNAVVRYSRRVKEPAHGICFCGEEVYLFDQYYGACQCPKCGRWYNLFGQEMLPPEYWEHDPSEEEWE